MKRERGIHRCDLINVILDSSESIQVKKVKTKKNVRFDDVTVYYFARSQSFVSVPSQGTVTLGKCLVSFSFPFNHWFLTIGMVPEHSHVEQYSVSDFSRLRRAVHKSILRERKLLPPPSSSCKSFNVNLFLCSSEKYLAVDNNDTDDDEPLPVDDYYFVQPIATRQRRTLLKQSGLMKIDPTEKDELTLIRRSREVCGCSCTRETGGCQPLTCDCYLNGIACQVDRLTFPCPCATMLCQNPLGRLEFNQNRVRNHFFETITRLNAEKEDNEIFILLQSLISSIDSLVQLHESR